MKLTRLFKDFFESEKSGGIVLLLCTIVSLIISNTSLQNNYFDIWHFEIAGYSFEHWINEGLMAIFFLFIGLELERELYTGELSNVKNVLLPIFGAVGGMVFPAALFLLFNFGTPTQAGAGIPTATDIAFALGILSILGKLVRASLKVFLTALAVIDDLGAIIIIAVFYSTTLALSNLITALAIFILLIALNRLKVFNLIPYIIGGMLMWYFMSRSGVHATITGVLLAFAIPFRKRNQKSPSDIVLHNLHKPVAFIILPLFALANTSIIIGNNWADYFSHPVSLGILTGLIIGKPLGITLFSYLAVMAGICTLPKELNWKNVIGVGFIAGVGFTMSIFITLLAFEQAELITLSKLMILIASLIAGSMGFVWLRLSFKNK